MVSFFTNLLRLGRALQAAEDQTQRQAVLSALIRAVYSVLDNSSCPKIIKTYEHGLNFSNGFQFFGFQGRSQISMILGDELPRSELLILQMEVILNVEGRSMTIKAPGSSFQDSHETVAVSYGRFLPSHNGLFQCTTHM